MLRYSYNREKLDNKLIYIIHLNNKNLKDTHIHITLDSYKIYNKLTLYNNFSYISFFIGSKTYEH